MSHLKDFIAQHKYANQIGYSDVTPYEIVKIVSGKTIEIRRMDYEKDPNFKMEIDVGGFCAHVINNSDQTWIITPNEENPVKRIRYHKSGHWKDAHGNKYQLSDKPQRFYDYNF